MSKLKLLDVLLLGLSLAFIVIGIDQTIFYGFENSYWAFMLALTLFFTFTLRKGRQNAQEHPSDQANPRSGKPARKK
jgi:hypothetical protein